MLRHLVTSVLLLDIIVGHAIKAHKVVGLETSPAKKTVSNPHYRKIAHLCTYNSPQHESSTSKQLSTACTNSHSEQREEEGALALLQWGQWGAMAPSLLSYFSIVSMSWFTFSVVSIIFIMLWPPHLFSASNAPGKEGIMLLRLHKCKLTIRR